MGTPIARLTAAVVAVLALGGWPALAQGLKGWLSDFDVNVAELKTTGRNPFVILEPGYQLTLEGRESGKTVQLVVTVLQETKVVGGVETRVVEERETNNGALVEVSRNYFAIHPGSLDVYYFGEDVDIYKDGKVKNHDGTWHHGEKGARFGLFMPGNPQVGMMFYQEQAPRVALDRVQIVSLTDQLVTPAGTFDGCLRMRETTPLEPLVSDTKVYARNVGIVKDGSLLLTRSTGARGQRGG